VGEQQTERSKVSCCLACLDKRRKGNQETADRDYPCRASFDLYLFSPGFETQKNSVSEGFFGPTVRNFTVFVGGKTLISSGFSIGSVLEKSCR